MSILVHICRISSLIYNRISPLFLSAETKKFDFTSRLFELSSTIGEFVAEEITCPFRSEALNPFPFSQSNIYSVPQPGELIKLKSSYMNKVITMYIIIIQKLSIE